MDAPDPNKLEEVGRQLISALGEDPTREGLRDTPRRFAKAWAEFVSGYGPAPEGEMRTFCAEGFDEMVLVKGIRFFSMCEHHLLPVVGTVSVGYVPNGRVVGLSKIPRIVERFGRRLQNQERMTAQIADALEAALTPRGVAVLCSAEHFCMSMRGVKQVGALTDTSAVRGIFRTDPRTRAEFFSLCRPANQ